jgi:integrase
MDRTEPRTGLGRFVKSETPARQAVSLPSPEVDNLLRTAKAELAFRDYALLFTALRAGLREGELAGLQWGDVQFGETEADSERYILVQRKYDRRWSRQMLTPKSRKSRRVDMSRVLRRALLELRGQQAASVEGRHERVEGLVFPSDANTPIEMNNFVQRVFAPPLTRAGLRKIRFHDLRHTFGSLLIQAGASLAYVRDQMGHSSIQVKVDIYGHLVPGANICFVDRLDAAAPAESATPAQQSARPSSDPFPQHIEKIWLGGRDSNPDTQIQNLQSYRWTTSQRGAHRLLASVVRALHDADASKPFYNLRPTIA